MIQGDVAGGAGGAMILVEPTPEMHQLGEIDVSEVSTMPLMGLVAPSPDTKVFEELVKADEVDKIQVKVEP